MHRPGLKNSSGSSTSVTIMIKLKAVWMLEGLGKGPTDITDLWWLPLWIVMKLSPLANLNQSAHKSTISITLSFTFFGRQKGDYGHWMQSSACELAYKTLQLLHFLFFYTTTLRQAVSRLHTSAEFKNYTTGALQEDNFNSWKQSNTSAIRKAANPSFIKFPDKCAAAKS